MLISPNTIIVNIAIEVFSSVLCVVFIISILVTDGLKSRLNQVFLCVLLSNIALMLSDALAFASIGKPGAHNLIFNYIGNICTYFFSYVIIMCFANYMAIYLSAKVKIKQTAVYVVYGICGVAIILIFVSLWNGMYFYIDENNIYHRRELYWLSQILGILGILVNMWVIVRHRKYFNRIEKFVLSTYIILPVIAVTIQMLVYGLVSVYIASTITILLIYVGLQSEQSKRLKEKELELTNSKIAVMLSQIQPHFLYNSLVSIRQLYKIDPVIAGQTLIELSIYLRSNMDSLTLKNPIPFETELKHVESYLSLEQKRFGDKVKIEYDIRTDDFMLPALALQPIVENAVRYGITKREHGGTITIRTEESDDFWHITVIDDGVGFDPKVSKQDGRSHIGIENVRNRLSSMC